MAGASKKQAKKQTSTVFGMDTATLQWAAIFAVIAVVTVVVIVMSDGSTPSPHGG